MAPPDEAAFLELGRIPDSTHSWTEDDEKYDGGAVSRRGKRNIWQHLRTSGRATTGSSVGRLWGRGRCWRPSHRHRCSERRPPDAHLGMEVSVLNMSNHFVVEWLLCEISQNMFSPLTLKCLTVVRRQSWCWNQPEPWHFQPLWCWHRWMLRLLTIEKLKTRKNDSKAFASV